MDTSNPAICGRFKTGHFRVAAETRIKVRSFYLRQDVAGLYPDTTFGPAPGAAHRFATRIRALRMNEATAKRNLITARIFVIEPPTD
jgi:hypothetical protein